MAVGIKIEGYREAVDILTQLPDNMQKQMIRKTLRRAAKPMLATARAKTPRRSGMLSKMLRIVSLRRDSAHPTQVSIAIKPVWSMGKKSGKINQYYGLFVHEGTQDRKPKNKKLLKFTNANGEMIFTRTARGLKPTPFLEEAYAVDEHTVINGVGDAMAEEIGLFISKKFNKK